MIGTYGELKAAVANWLARDDLTARIPELIALVEADLNQNPGFRLGFMESRADNETTAGEPFVAVPGDLLEVRSLVLQTSSTATLDYVTPGQLTAIRAGSERGRPRLYTLIGDEIRLAPVPDAAYGLEVTYWARIAASGPGSKPDAQKALSDAVPTNWVLANAPDIYLYGALATAEPYLGNDARLATWASLYGRAVDKAIRAERRRRMPAGGLAMRTATSTP